MAKALRDWIAAVGAKTAYIMPAVPGENGYCESFNSKLRDELLNVKSSTPSRRRRSSLSDGDATTTPCARTHRWATSRQPRRPCNGRLRNPDQLRRPRQQ